MMKMEWHILLFIIIIYLYKNGVELLYTVSFRNVSIAFLSSSGEV